MYEKPYLWTWIFTSFAKISTESAVRYHPTPTACAGPKEDFSNLQIWADQRSTRGNHKPEVCSRVTCKKPNVTSKSFLLFNITVTCLKLNIQKMYIINNKYNATILYATGRGWIQELISFNSNVNSLGSAPIQLVALKELTLAVILLPLLVQRQENQLLS